MASLPWVLQGRVWFGQRVEQVSFTLQFDYRFDSTGFFNDPARRAALEAAASVWEAVIQDDFSDVPAGTTFSVRNPTTGSTEAVTLDKPIDDILIFVGAAQFGTATLAIAGPDGGNAAGDIFAARISSDFRDMGAVTDFEPWAGSITFNIDANWSFAQNDAVAGRNDFISVAVHEIGHVLGIGTSAAFDRWIIDDHFIGPNATQTNNGRPIPVEDDHAHVEDGFADDTVALDPVLTTGTRVGLSEFDKAILADIGYHIAGFEKQGTAPSITSTSDERIFGTTLDDFIDGLAGDDSIQGAEGDDQLLGNNGQDDLFGQSGNDTLSGGSGDDYLDGGAGHDELIGGPGADVYFGHEGQDTFVISSGDGSNRLSDFDLNSDTIRLVDSGFASAAEVMASISKPFSNVSRLTFDDGTTVDVFHSSRTSTPLTPEHFVIAGSESEALPSLPALEDNSRSIAGSGSTADVLNDVAQFVGTNGNDVIVAAVTHNWIDGLQGVDTVSFAGNQSDYTIQFHDSGFSIVDRTAQKADPVQLENIELITFDVADPSFGEVMDMRLFEGHRDLDPASLDAFVEMYIAYFNRAPDAVGLAFWGNAYADGTSLEEIAGLFMQQEETTTLYPDDMNNLRFVSEIYHNVLGRAPDMDGLIFWETALRSGAVNRSDFILELLNGAKVDAQPEDNPSFIARQAEDQRYLDMKTDLGARFALELGLSDLDGASQVMAMFDGSTESFESANVFIDEVYASALDPLTSAFLMPLIGVQDMPDVI
jgi:Ca2+-binding RTX toxin-like protein